MKGFIKSYSDFLGLDSAVVLEKYRDILDERQGEKKEEEQKPKAAWSYSRYTVLGIVTLSLLILITITKFLIAPETNELPAPIKPPTQAVVEKPAMTNATSHGIFTTAAGKLFQTLTAQKAPAAPPARPGAQSAQTTKMPAVKYTLLVTARELTWLRITADGREPMEVLMKKGETTTWTANQRLIVLSGNAGGVDLTLNGKPMGSLGPSGKIVTKVISE